MTTTTTAKTTSAVRNAAVLKVLLNANDLTIPEIRRAVRANGGELYSFSSIRFALKAIASDTDHIVVLHNGPQSYEIV